MDSVLALRTLSTGDGGVLAEEGSAAAASGNMDALTVWHQMRSSHLEDKDEVLGQTVLHIACRNGRVEVAAYLLQLGADVNSRTEAGATPLMLAAQEGHDSCAALLVEARADVDARSEVHHASALHLACRGGHTECARLLAHGGAALNDVVKTSELFSNGATALSFAVFASHRDIEFLLRQLGAPDAPLTREAFRSAIEWLERF